MHCFLKTIPKTILQRNANTDELLPRDHRNSVLKQWSKQASSGPPDSNWGGGVKKIWRPCSKTKGSEQWRNSPGGSYKEEILKGQTRHKKKSSFFTVKIIMDEWKNSDIMSSLKWHYLYQWWSQKVTNGIINLGNPAVLQWTYSTKVGVTVKE